MKSGIFQNLYNSIKSHPDLFAFFISDRSFTYRELESIIFRVQSDILSLSENKLIGLIANDDIQTYASILAILFSGKAYVPIDPKHPDDRNSSIIEIAELDCILSSDNTLLSENFLKTHRDRIIEINDELTFSESITIVPASPEDLAYILFTSGSTGIPKGVPIQRKSLEAFISALSSFNYNFTETDKFLQVFDLTFDLSIFSWLVPLLHGSCVYTIPKGSIRYAYAYDLLEEHKINVVLSVPSFLYFLRPYFPEINLPHVKYWFFCGEALHLDIVQEWQKCIPNALIENVYGPTEATIFCTRYIIDESHQKALNGILSIGQPFPGVNTVIVDENLNQVKNGETGELCLSGDQVSPGYLKNEEKNLTAFFPFTMNGKASIFYRTGDLCFQDDEGDYMFCGRLDTQVKIQGFRVELGEIENAARSFEGIENVVALATTDEKGNTYIHLFLETNSANIQGFQEYLKAKIPSYMFPRVIYPMQRFPLNVNGKIDKPTLRKSITTI